MKEQRKIRIKFIRDSSLRLGWFKVEADIKGAWGIHRAISEGRVSRRWAVSHVPTGIVMASGLKTKREAKALVEGLLELPPGDEKGIPRETRLGFCSLQKRQAA